MMGLKFREIRWDWSSRDISGWPFFGMVNDMVCMIISSVLSYCLIDHIVDGLTNGGVDTSVDDVVDCVF